MGRFDLLGGQIYLLRGQMPTQLTCYLPPWWIRSSTAELREPHIEYD